MTARTEQVRGAMNARYRVLRQRAPAVPRWVVAAFVAAEFDRRDLAEACALRHFGVGMDGLGVAGRQCARGWARTLAAAGAVESGRAAA